MDDSELRTKLEELASDGQWDGLLWVGVVFMVVGIPVSFLFAAHLGGSPWYGITPLMIGAGLSGQGDGGRRVQKRLKALLSEMARARSSEQADPA